jgi:hypothetical protein
MPKTQIKPLLAPRGGLRYDLPADLISEMEMSDCRNVIFEDGLIKKRYGYATMGTNLPLDGTVLGMDQFYKFDGNSWLLVMTENQIYKWIPADSLWNTISDALGTYGANAYGAGAYGANGGDAFTGTDSDLFSYDYIRKSTETDPWWIMTNGVDKIKKFTGTGTISNLISDYPTGVTSLLSKHVIEFKDHLLLLDVIENGNRYPQRVRWSDTADPEDFINGNASYQDLSGADWIVGVIKFKGDYLIVVKERSVWVGYATGDSDIFQFDQKVTGTGCPAGRTIESLGDEIIFLGWDDVYVFNGINYEPIGTPVQRRLFETLNPEEIGRCFGVVIEEQKEYWLFVPSTDKSHISGSGPSTYPDIAWCFNYELNKWTRHTYNDFITMYGYYELESTRTWADLIGSWKAQTWRWDDRTTLQAAPTNLFGDSSGNIYEYSRSVNNEDGTAIDAWFSTKDINPTQLMQRFRALRLDVYYTGNGLTVHYSIDKGKSWVSVGTLSANNNMEDIQRLFLRLDTNMVRFRFRNNTAGEHFEFSRANLYWQPAGGRL